VTPAAPDEMPSLPADADALRALLLATSAERDALTSERDALAAERDALAEQNERVLHLLLKLRRLQFGRKSERLSEDQLQFGAVSGDRDAPPEARLPGLRRRGRAKPGSAATG
jgi:transposase